MLVACGRLKTIKKSDIFDEYQRNIQKQIFLKKDVQYEEAMKRFENEKRPPEEGGSEEIQKFFSNTKNVIAFSQSVYQIMSNISYINDKSRNVVFLNALKTNLCDHEMIYEAFKDSINVIDLGHSAPILSFILDFDDPQNRETTFSTETEEFLMKYAKNKEAPSIDIFDITSTYELIRRFCSFKLQHNAQLQNHRRGNKMDEGTWAKATVDSFIEAISNDVHEKNISRMDISILTPNPPLVENKN
ncbi:8785_t:CDS:2, partial [Gigaspora margarita]